MARTVPVHTGYTVLNGSGTGSNGVRIDVWVEYKLGQPDPAANSTPISAYFYAALNPSYTSTTTYYIGLNSSLTVNGAQGIGVENGAYDFTAPDKLNLLASYSGNIVHESDGTAEVTFVGAFTTASSYISGGDLSAKVTLPPIAQAAEVFAGDVILGEKCSLQWTPTSVEDSFTATFSLGDWSEITDRIYPDTLALFTYTETELPLTLASQFKTRSASMTVVLTTYRGDKLLGSRQAEFTVTVPENQQTRPRLTAKPCPECAAFPGVFVQRLGKIRAEAYATDPYGADITDWRIVVDGVTTQGKISDFLEKSGTLPVRVEVTNSRGFTGAWEGSVLVYPYDRPRVYGAANRCLADGTVDPGGTYLHLVGYYQVYPLGGKNTGLLEWRIKPSGGEYSPWQTMTEWGVLPDVALEREQAYQVQLRVTDTAGSTAELTFAIPAEQIYMHRTPNGLGIGGYVGEENTLAVHWDITAHKGINGAYLRTLTVEGTELALPMTGTVLVLGDGILGVLTVTETGAQWQGTEGVTATADTLILPRAGSRLLLLSPEFIEI